MIFAELFLTFFKIGLFTFGGGYAMLPLIQEEAVARGWQTSEQLIDFIAVSESTPGPFAVNMATYVGSETGGFFGALCATLGVVLPSFIIILIVAKFYDKYRQNRIVKGCMSGLKPAVVGLIGAAALSVAMTVFFPGVTDLSFAADPAFWISLGILVLCLLLAFKKLHPIVIIGLSAGLGILFGCTLGPGI